MMKYLKNTSEEQNNFYIVRLRGERYDVICAAYRFTSQQLQSIIIQ